MPRGCVSEVAVMADRSDRHARSLGLPMVFGDRLCNEAGVGGIHRGPGVRPLPTRGRICRCNRTLLSPSLHSTLELWSNLVYG